MGRTMTLGSGVPASTRSGHRARARASLRNVTLQRWVAAALALLLASVPALALQCDPRDAEAMACCERGVSECHKPAQKQDCCRPGPAPGQSAGLAHKIEGAEKGTVKFQAAVVVVPAAWVATPEAAVTVHPLAPQGVALDPSPPRSPVLRI